MIDPKYIRENPAQIIKIIESGRGNPQKADIKRWLELDEKRSAYIKRLEELNRERNNVAQLGKENPEVAREKGRVLKEKLEYAKRDLETIEKEWQEILDWIPNIPVSDTAMPLGKSEDDNPIVKAWLPGIGYLAKEKLGTVKVKLQEFGKSSIHWDSKLENPKHHIDIGKDLKIIDNEQSAITSGSRFTYIRGDGALLQYAIQQLLFTELFKREFIYQIPPLLVKHNVLYGTSHFPEGIDQAYKINSYNTENSEELYLVGSSEPSNFAYFMGKTLKEEELPIKLFAYTSCFRSEVGSWGRDVRGIKRVHQFDKIEMNIVCTEKQSTEMFNELLSINEWLLQTLEVPYRLARKCTSDGGYLASAEQIDPEVWLPAQQEFMEVGTDTNTTDFQARRLNIKVLGSDGSKHYAHTVNDTGVAMGRMIIAIIDNYQQSDGSVKVPKSLIKYTGKEYIK